MILNSINAVLPLFMMCLIGVLAKKLNIIDEKTGKKMGWLAYNILFPCSFFLSTYNGKGKIDLQPKTIILVIAIEIITFLLAMLVAKLTFKEPDERGPVQQTIFRSNMILFGTSLANYMLSAEQAAVYTISLLIILPMQNLGSVLGKEIYGNSKDGKIDYVKTIKNVLLSPYTVAIIVALIVVKLNIELPQFIKTTCSNLGSAASPLQLIILGSSLKMGGLKSNISKLIIGVFIKLVLVPAIFVPVIILFNLSYVESFIVLLLCAAPSAITAFTVSQQAGWKMDYVNQMIVFTTILSLLSLTFWMYILQVLV